MIEDRIVRPRDLPGIIGLSDRCIRYQREQGQFPKPLKLTDGRPKSRAIGWPLTEIKAWMKSRGLATSYTKVAK